MNPVTTLIALEAHAGAIVEVLNRTRKDIKVTALNLELEIQEDESSNKHKFSSQRLLNVKDSDPSYIAFISSPPEHSRF